MKLSDLAGGTRSVNVREARRRWPFLEGLMVVGAGCSVGAEGAWRLDRRDEDLLLLIYCAKGDGWCELDARRHAVRRGDLAVLCPEVSCAGGPHGSGLWTIHWIGAVGTHLSAYGRELASMGARPVVGLGESWPIVALFHEVREQLEDAATPWNVFHATHAFGHLLSLVLRTRGRNIQELAPGVHQVARSITFMSEHLGEPMSVRTLAEHAGLSAAHFTVLFREQTGASPHAYLNLLRMHRAGEWLKGTTLSVKEIAGRLGFRDPFHFSRTFKAFSGKAPTAYRGGKV